jgi:hypothetical protein
MSHDTTGELTAEARMTQVVDGAAAASDSEYQLERNLRQSLGVSGGQPETDDASAEAWRPYWTLWAFDYRLTPRERPELSPSNRFADGASYPPELNDIGDDVVAWWENLACLVRHPVARARLSHLLFVLRRGNGRDRAGDAARAYLDMADARKSRLELVSAYGAALSLARQTGQGEIATAALEAIVRLTKVSLAAERREPGVALGLIRELINDHSPPAETDELLDLARRTYEPDPWITDSTIALQLVRAKGDATRTDALQRERVETWLRAAENSDGLVRSVHLQTAVRYARDSGDSVLAEQATARLQELRFADLGLTRLDFEIRRPRGAADAWLAPVVDADSWQEALAAFARFGPVSGPAEDNLRAVAENARRFPLGNLFPPVLLGGDGLPRFTATNEEQSAELALAQHEGLHININGGLVAEALVRIMERFGIPDEGELGAYFSRNPGVAPSLGAALARAFVRFWAGDVEGAAFTAVPRIEALARNLVLATRAGIYRVQRQATPGVYPGLGSLLPELRRHGLDESWYRFIHTLCVSVAGPNLRNEVAHGFVDDVGVVHAALLLQAAAYLASLGVSPRAPEESDTGSPDAEAEAKI